jgi:hypothetical protein
MMRTKIDRRKVRLRMAMSDIETFDSLLERSGVAQTTFYTSLDSTDWKSRTLDALANALSCQPWELTTREEVAS